MRPRRPSCRLRSTPTTPPSRPDADKMAELEKEEEALSARIQEIMYTIPR